MVRVAQILSLDVVLGACVGTWFVARIAQTSLDTASTLALAICVWLIYTADHLRDASRLPHRAHTPRHRYHQAHFRTIRIAFALVAGLGVGLLFYLPAPVVRLGVGLTTLVGVYFLISQLAAPQQIIPKELMVAFLYSGGIFLPVIAQVAVIPGTLGVLFGQYVVLALVNLVIFSWYEYESDRLDAAHSVATLYGKTQARRLAVVGILGLFISVVGCMALFSHLRLFFTAQILVLLMTALLGVLLVRPAFFRQHERYRWLGDSTFLIPLLLAPFNS